MFYILIILFLAFIAWLADQVFGADLDTTDYNKHSFDNDTYSPPQQSALDIEEIDLDAGLRVYGRGNCSTCDGGGCRDCQD
jgi:hypothetical protein